MRAMVLDSIGSPLRSDDVRVPAPGAEQVLIRVSACGVCRTDLHVVDGELKDPKLPLIPGHQIVGTVEETGERVERFAAGDRVGVPGLDGPAMSVATAVAAGRTCAITLNSPGTRSTVAMPSTPWPTTGSASPSPWLRTCRRRRFFAPGSSGTALSA